MQVASVATQRLSIADQEQRKLTKLIMGALSHKHSLNGVKLEVLSTITVHELLIYIDWTLSYGSWYLSRQPLTASVAGRRLFVQLSTYYFFTHYIFTHKPLVCKYSEINYLLYYQYQFPQLSSQLEETVALIPNQVLILSNGYQYRY